MRRLFGDWLRSTKKASSTQTSNAELPDIPRRYKRTCQGGDPFAEHRRRNVLPEEYEFGMNCLLDTLMQLGGLERAQRTYAVIREDPRSYTICRNCPPATPETGTPILFTLANLDVAFKAGGRAERLLEVALFAYCEPEPTETLGLDMFIGTVNEALHGMNMPALDELSMIAFTTGVDRMKDCPDLSSGVTILYKSKAGEFWHFLAIHDCDDVFVYGPQDRKVILPYCVDEAGKVLLVAPRSTKQKWFRSDGELDKQEIKNIVIAYRYKAYDETIQKYDRLLVDRD